MLRTTLGLLSSMVSGGEEHSDSSLKKVRLSFNTLDAIEKRECSLNDIILKSKINAALSKHEGYWGFREDKQAEITEDVFKAIDKHLNKEQ